MRCSSGFWGVVFALSILLSFDFCQLLAPVGGLLVRAVEAIVPPYIC
jgi:hypothetical protein